MTNGPLYAIIKIYETEKGRDTMGAEDKELLFERMPLPKAVRVGLFLRLSPLSAAHRKPLIWEFAVMQILLRKKS